MASSFGTVQAARQVALQRRGYAAAVLRALARNQRGRTTAQIQRTLRDSLTPLGLRLSNLPKKSSRSGQKASERRRNRQFNWSENFGADHAAAMTNRRTANGSENPTAGSARPVASVASGVRLQRRAA